MALLDEHVDRLVERGRGGQRDDRDARRHHLVQAPVAELDDRVDHLLLLGLQDALLATALDDEPQLLGRDRLFRRHAGAEEAGDGLGRAGQEQDDRRQDPREQVDRAGQDDGEALGVGEREGLRDELGEEDREQREDDRDDDERQASSRCPRSMPAPARSPASWSLRLTAA